MTNRAVADVDRIGKLLRLALTTDKTHEAIAAIGAINRLLAAENLDVHWLADRLTAPVAHADDHGRGRDDDDDDQNDDHSKIWFAFHRRHRLSPRESAFIESLHAWHGPLSFKQRQWLSNIVDRLDAG